MSIKKSAIVFFLFITSTVFSQVEFGLNIGIGAANVRIQNPSSVSDLFESNSNPMAVSFGPSITLGVTDKWSIKGGLNMSFNPSALEFNGDSSYAISTSFTSQEQRYQNLYIELPVVARYHLRKRDKAFSPYTFFGAVYDYQLLETCPVGMECLNHTRDYNLGTILGVGFELSKLDVAAKTQFGLLNTITEDYQISADELKMHKDLFMIEIGYKF